MCFLYVNNQLLELSGSVIKSERQSSFGEVSYLVRVQYSKDFFVDIISFSFEDENIAKKYADKVVRAISWAVCGQSFISVEIEEFKSGIISVKLFDVGNNLVTSVTTDYV